MKYQSELIKEIVDKRGHKFPSLHYQSECVESWIEETKGSYPKLCDYTGEWLNYIVEKPIGEFPYVTISDVREATINNVVPYAYRSAILKGSTKYRDIETGEILEVFEDGRNLELVSVKMPVLTTTGKNLWNDNDWSKGLTSSTGVIQTGGTYDGFRYNNKLIPVKGFDKIYCRTFAELDGVSIYNYRVAEYDSNKTFLHMIVSASQYYTVSNDCEYIRVHFDLRHHPNQTVPTDDIPTYGVVTTEPISNYEPYKTNILTVNEDVELRGIGEVQDTLDCLTGEMTQNTLELNLKEIKNWYLYNGSEKNGTVAFYCNSSDYFKIYTSSPRSLLCNSLSPTNGDVVVNSDYECVCIGGNFLKIRIATSKLTDISARGLIEYLQQNNVIVVGIAKTPTVKTVDLTVTEQDGNTKPVIRPIEGTMHLMAEGESIKPLFSGEIPVEAITQNLATFIKE